MSKFKLTKADINALNDLEDDFEGHEHIPAHRHKLDDEDIVIGKTKTKVKRWVRPTEIDGE